MRAKLTQMLSGPIDSYEVGQEVDGDFAVRLVEAGYAVPIVEKTLERATKPKLRKETR